MKDWNIKEDKAQNAIYLKEDNGGKGRFFRARFLQPGLVKYSFGVCLLTKEVIDKFVYKFVGCPVVIDHKDVTDESAKDMRVGVISKVDFDPFDAWYWCEGVIFDQEAIDLVNNGYNVSCQYEITQYATNDKEELHNGNPYDKEILDGAPEHLAIVKNPRYENAMIAVNAIDLTASNEEKWITIKPHGEESEDFRRLKLEDGESPEEAIKRVYKDDKKENSSKRTYKDAEKDRKELLDNLIKKYGSADKVPEQAKEEYLKKDKELADERLKLWTKENNKKYKEIKEADEAKKDEKKATELKLKGKSQEIVKIVDLVKEKTGIDLSDYKGYVEDNGWSSEEQLYIDFGQLKKDWFRKDNNKYRDTLYWLNIYSDSDWNGGWGTFIKPKDKASNSFIDQFKDTLYTVLAEGITNRLGE